RSALQDRAFQPGKSCEVAVERQPFASPFDGERSIPGVSCHWAKCVCLDAKTLKYLPVSFAWLECYAMRLNQQAIAERERGGGWCRIGIGFPIRDNSHESGENQFGYCKTRIARDRIIQPCTANAMMCGIVPKGIDEDIDVRQDHLKPFKSRWIYSASSISSRSLNVITPGA